MADRRKLAQGLMMMTPSARADIAQQADEFERFKQADYLRKMGEQGAGLAKSVARGVPQMATGLVDLASMPFEAAGVLEPGQAVGSTKWLESRGYLPESQPGFANQLTELLSGGFDPSDLITKGAPMLAALRTTWHGSPHGFTKFDMSKIGTGEGAQAYGHGLYLADAPETATSYAKPAIQDIRMTPEGKMFDLNTGETIGPIQGFPKHEDLLKDKQGYLYKVDLPDEQIAKMLDWDKPLSEQPEVMNYLRQSDVFGPNSPSWAGAPEGAWERNIGARTGSDFYLKNKWADDQAKGSAMLYEAGIPGIQYLDQASRGAGEGTRNYVVFSDEIPQILERNGQPIAQALRDYRGAHTAPGPEFGAQLHDLTGGGQMYPDDVYSPNAYRFYGHGGPDVALDKETTKIAQSFRGKPDEMVDIYRAVPNEADITSINAGDWITINPNYAKQHGESQLGGNYKILQQKVPAKTIWTNADSIHEYGYWPE